MITNKSKNAFEFSLFFYPFIYKVYIIYNSIYTQVI